ncbi:MAG: hypothetical protein HDT29_07200 [Clostridiales bacterium]|nr:hypothetical protein [Clostridiales bacterium]
MNMLRYKKENINEVVSLLKSCENLVDLPTNSFKDVAALLKDSIVDSEKMSKLLGKYYTILAWENEEIIGLASMNGEGEIGWLVVREGNNVEKTAKGLFRAVERGAVKRKIPTLYVWKLDESEKLLSKCGFEFEKLIGDEYGEMESYLMVKKLTIEEKKKVELLPEDVKRFQLDPSKPIKVEGKAKFFPIFIFALACFFIALLIGITINNYNNSPDGKLDSKFTMFFIIFGTFFVVALAIFIAYIAKGIRLKKEVLTMNITNGLIIDEFSHEHKVYDEDRIERTKYIEVSLTYVFYDEEMQKRTGKFNHKYESQTPKFYVGQEVVVAFSQGKCYILKKYTLR